LITTPASPLELMLGKLVPYVFIGLIQTRHAALPQAARLIRTKDARCGRVPALNWCSRRR